MTNLEILLGIDALLKRPTDWTLHALARDKNGRAVDPTAEDACRWCLLGAYMKVLGIGAHSIVGADPIEIKLAAYDVRQLFCLPCSVGVWNDDILTFERLKADLKERIEKERRTQ